jgi:hypothetical protein
MDMDVKMRPVIREVSEFLNSDGDASKAVEIHRVINKYNLDEKEIRHLCRHFGVLTEDLG